ncbi:hemoglobin [Fodinibius sediminis]|uniref:Hemoglobin n=1 Tax=Fodinibius sediminis TaxID=1214077 RepID=A0A521ERN8_9BACT|nr:hemoglobin [Fodinibius sediminis]
MGDIRNDQDVKVLVHNFYEKVQNDDRLGYIFNDVAEVAWDEHLPKMVDFWSNLLFQTGRYKGRPFRQHMPLPIKEGDFDRWYRLFEETVDELYRGDKANFAKQLARNIASSFELRMEKDGLLKKE